MSIEITIKIDGQPRRATLIQPPLTPEAMRLYVARKRYEAEHAPRMKARAL